MIQYIGNIKNANNTHNTNTAYNTTVVDMSVCSIFFHIHVYTID